MYKTFLSHHIETFALTSRNSERENINNFFFTFIKTWFKELNNLQFKRVFLGNLLLDILILYLFILAAAVCCSFSNNTFRWRPWTFFLLFYTASKYLKYSSFQVKQNLLTLLLSLRTFFSGRFFFLLLSSVYIFNV